MNASRFHHFEVKCWIGVGLISNRTMGPFLRHFSVVSRIRSLLHARVDTPKIRLDTLWLLYNDSGREPLKSHCEKYHTIAGAHNGLLTIVVWMGKASSKPAFRTIFCSSLLLLCNKTCKRQGEEINELFCSYFSSLEATGCLIRTITYLMMAMKAQERTNLNGNLSSWDSQDIIRVR